MNSVEAVQVYKFYKGVTFLARRTIFCIFVKQPFVSVQTVPCTLLHGIGARKVMVSGHLLLAAGDF